MSDPSMDAAVQGIRDAHQASRTRLRHLAQISRLLTVAMLVIALLFVASFYSKVTTMYAPEEFEGPLQIEAEKLLPKLEPELRALWSETSAVYGDMAKNKLEQSLPQFLEASEEEFNLLVESLRHHAEQRLSRSLERIGDKHGRRLREDFPNLSNEEEAERLVLEWMESIESDFGMILARLEIRYSENLGSLQATVEQFHNEEFEAMSEDDLTRQFVHLWLMKVDRWVMLGDEGLALNQVEVENHDG